MSVVQRYRQRSTAERLDLPTRWSLLGISGSEPLLATLLVGAQGQVRAPGVAALLVVSGLHAVACVLLLRAGLGQAAGGPRPRTGLFVATAALAAVGVAVGATAFPAYLRLPAGSDQGGTPAVVEMVLLFAGATTLALTPLLRTRGLLVAVLVPAAGLAAVQASSGTSGGKAGAWALQYIFFVGSVVVTYRVSVWSLGLIWEIDRSREVQARLAVVEERLRFARDLHDVLGRNLALVAVKSELAAELARAGQPGSVEQMLEVRQVAQDSMREVRAVVGGYRETDLDTELAGARSVLGAAGVTTRFIGNGAGLPPAAQTTLGWVVREATTNIIRHSEATFARIDLDVDQDAVVLQIENDGVRAPGTASSGNGLTGLQERLAALGGRLTITDLPQGRFLIQAHLPLRRIRPPSQTARPTPTVEPVS